MTTIAIDWGARHTRIVHAGQRPGVRVDTALTYRGAEVLLGHARDPHPDDVVIRGADLHRGLRGTGAAPSARPLEELLAHFFGLLAETGDDAVVVAVPHGWLLPGTDAAQRLHRICAERCHLPVRRVVSRATAALAHLLRQETGCPPAVLVADLGAEPLELTRFTAAGGLFRHAATATGADVDAVVSRVLAGDGALGVLLAGGPDEVAGHGEMVLAAVRHRHRGPVAELTPPRPELAVALGAGLIADGTVPLVDVLAENVAVGAHRHTAGRPENHWLPVAAPFTLRTGAHAAVVDAGRPVTVRVDAETPGLPVRLDGRELLLPLRDGLAAGGYQLAVRLDEDGLDVVLHTGDPRAGHHHRVTEEVS